MDPTAGPQNSQPPSTQWDALLSVQKENARLRRILAADKPPPAPTGRKRPPPRGVEQDEIQSDEESDAGPDEACAVDVGAGVDQMVRQLALKREIKREKAELCAQQRELLDKQRQYDTDRGQLAAWRAQLSAAQEALDLERGRLTQQAAADLQQSKDRLAAAEAFVKKEKRELGAARGQLKAEWASVAEWKARLEAEGRDVQRRRVRLDADTRWLMDENTRLDGEKTSLAQENAQLLAERQAQNREQLVRDNERLGGDNIRLWKENAKLQDEKKTHLADIKRLQREHTRLLEESKSRLLDNKRLKCENKGLLDENKTLTERTRVAEGDIARLKDEADGIASAERWRVEEEHRMLQSILAKGPIANLTARAAGRQSSASSSSSSSPALPQPFTSTSTFTSTRSSPCMPSPAPSPPPSSPPGRWSARKRSRVTYENENGDSDFDPDTDTDTDMDLGTDSVGGGGCMERKVHWSASTSAPRGRGGLRKVPAPITAPVGTEGELAPTFAPRRGRGRPRKVPAPTTADADVDELVSTSTSAPRPRGRPRKVSAPTPPTTPAPARMPLQSLSPNHWHPSSAAAPAAVSWRPKPEYSDYSGAVGSRAPSTSTSTIVKTETGRSALERELHYDLLFAASTTGARVQWCRLCRQCVSTRASRFLSFSSH
ncbi:hypothetical protein B0H14DRAFT_2849054 [Mycena olivaceomarginata]|nr:hypothetical protein B0H14DRAFT_2849054 [Mycena olivaceomarginata]